MGYRVEVHTDVTVRDHDGRIIEEFGVTREGVADNSIHNAGRHIHRVVREQADAVTESVVSHAKLAEVNERERLG